MTRRRKNRKQEPASLLVSARLILTVGFVAVTAILYLALCGRCENLGQDIKGLEAERDEIRVQMETERYKWSRLTSPRRFREILAQHGLDMTWPDESRVVRLDAGSLRPFESEVAEGVRLSQSRERMRHD